MAENGNYTSVELTSPTEESLPAYSSTWTQDVPEKEPKKRWNWRSWSDWTSACRNVPHICSTTWRTLRSTTPAEWASAYADAPYAFNRAIGSYPNPNGSRLSWRLILSKEQWLAFFLVWTFGITPMILTGYFTPRSGYPNGFRPFYGIFQDKIQSCGNSFGTPENGTVSGVEKLFVLDKTVGSFTFSQAKVMDVAWDVLIGRGVQLVAWWVGYIVFSDALLRAIERHPASFRIFQRIALEGPSLMALWTLVRELWCAKSKRTRALFFYMWLSTLYIISIPMFLSAMTGYDSTSIPWVSLDDSNNIIPASTLKQSGLAVGTWTETWNENLCFDYDQYNRIYSALYLRRDSCNCQLSNGTIVNATQLYNSPYYYTMSYHNFGSYCKFDYPGNNQTFTKTLDYYNSEGQRGDVLQCAHSFNITINNKPYEALDLNTTTGYCYNNKAYNYTFLQDRSRCLPDTANPTYQWGFSTMLVGLWIFLHFAWATSMYVVWQDAQFNSTLVKKGYMMTPLRAAIAMAQAAKRRTGMGEKQLVRANTKELNQELYGTRRRKGTKVEYGIFDEQDEEHGEVETVRRRSVRPTREDGREGEEITPVHGSSTPATPR